MPWVSGAAERAVRLKVTLKGLKPPVWRRLAGRGHDDARRPAHGGAGGDGLGEQPPAPVHARAREQIGDPRQLDDVEDEARRDGGRARGALGWKSFAYVYDMGDDWEHTIAIEGFEPLEPGRAYPACIGGKRACPPEDSGGPWGFAEMLEAVADPEDERHEEYKEWLGEFDPEAFSVEAAEARVRRWFEPKRRRKPRGKG